MSMDLIRRTTGKTGRLGSGFPSSAETSLQGWLASCFRRDHFRGRIADQVGRDIEQFDDFIDLGFVERTEAEGVVIDAAVSEYIAGYPDRFARATGPEFS